MEYAAKIINTRKLSSRGTNPDLSRSRLSRINAFILGLVLKGLIHKFKNYSCDFATLKIAIDFCHYIS